MGSKTTKLLLLDSLLQERRPTSEKVKMTVDADKGKLETATSGQPHLAKLTPLSPEVISRQATINIGTIGHVAHGKSTVVKALSGVHTVRFKNELERNITIKLGYANAKIYKSEDPRCQRPVCYTSASSTKEDVFKMNGFEYGLVRHVSEGKLTCQPIYSRIVSLFAEQSDLMYAVPGGLIGVGTKVDPTLCRADRMVGQVLGAVGHLPSILTELEVSYYLLRRL